MRGGPSHIYLRLLRGAVTSERYVSVIKRAVKMDFARHPQRIVTTPDSAPWRLRPEDLHPDSMWAPLPDDVVVSLSYLDELRGERSELRRALENLSGDVYLYGLNEISFDQLLGTQVEARTVLGSEPA